jgi:sugar diacid utilization regulator
MHGADLISFLLMRQLAILEGRREAGDYFFESLMSDDLTNEEAAERALTLGLRLTRNNLALAIGISRQSEDKLQLLRTCFERALSPWPHVQGKGQGKADILALLEAPEQFGSDDLERITLRVQELAAPTELPGLLVASGSMGKGLAGVRRTCSEATLAYEVGRRMGRAGVIGFEDLPAERLLAQIPRTPMSMDYIETTIGPLEAEPELIRTLEVFFEHGGNRVATSKAIPLHRSSLAYRLEKICRILDIPDLDDPDRRLELWLALRLRRVFGTLDIS